MVHLHQTLVWFRLHHVFRSNYESSFKPFTLGWILVMNASLRHRKCNMPVRRYHAGVLQVSFHTIMRMLQVHRPVAMQRKTTQSSGCVVFLTDTSYRSCLDCQQTFPFTLTYVRTTILQSIGVWWCCFLYRV